MLSAALVSLSLVAAAMAQRAGTVTAESHPRLPWQECTRNGGCVTKSNGAVTLDANWRWLHDKDGYKNCYSGNTWDSTLCPDGKTCVDNCAIEGAAYASTYGITTSGNSLTLKFVTKSENTNVGSRVYLMENETKYQMFNLLNKEFTFDVDVSKLGCGVNGALYFVQMDADGGVARDSGNKAGAKYGTGYCDSQCPRDIKFIGGEANVENWSGSATDPSAGTGRYGVCCAEMDIWEANSISTAYTPHPCLTQTDGGIQKCEGQECNTPDRYGGLCDPDGCDFNPYRMGHRDYYGPSKFLDTTKKMTVVTQFITHDNTTSGELVEIRRVYVQDGKVIPNSKVNFPGLLDQFDSITEKFCDDTKRVFNDNPAFQKNGGLAHMGRSLGHGHVLVLSIWDDHGANMLWLDSSYPTTADPSIPGVARGTCATTSGKPADVQRDQADNQVVFSNIKFGDIGSTYTGTLVTVPEPGSPVPTSTSTSTTSTTSTTTTTTAPAGPTQTQWGQCGGQGYSGPTACASGLRCNKINDWYSQCV